MNGRGVGVFACGGRFCVGAFTRVMLASPGDKTHWQTVDGSRMHAQRGENVVWERGVARGRRTAQAAPPARGYLVVMYSGLVVRPDGCQGPLFREYLQPS